ncbi:sugar kinase [uncultured Marinococcus sp.]|uniref:sugar kinase n=1 Tax=uncultured Marinococcus sp. TaxID=487012 RepID=UPI00260D5CCA|nr:sugar kinase [uncultured Marinococcus sp.]
MKKVVTVGELLMRLSPPSIKTIKQSDHLNFYYGGAEINVAVALSNLGSQSTVLTALPDNPLGEAAIAFLNKEGIDTSYIDIQGARLGTYFVENGTAERPSNVTYDRMFSSFSTWSPTSENWDSILDEVDILHITGITLALGENCRHNTKIILEEAKKRNINISFDFNYRSKLWSIDEARAAFEEVLPYITICFGNVSDLTDILKKAYSDTSTTKEIDTIIGFLKEYNIKWFASTNRKVETNELHHLQGSLIHQNGDSVSSPAYCVHVCDRVGGGDAFAAGILHKINLQQHTMMQETINFATATGVLAHTLKGDSFILKQEDVEAYLEKQYGTDMKR